MLAAIAPTSLEEIDINTYKYVTLAVNRCKIPLIFLTNRKIRGYDRFGDHRLAKKETAMKLSLWWARRDLNPHVRSEH